MDESLWPARNVAEYAYCPRLFYHMQVEGIFVPSSDTEQGAAVHQRVDKPSALSGKDETASVDPDRPKIVRSLVLTDASLGLTATLDLAELTGDKAVPVEYRKGSPRRVAMDPLPNDPDEAEQVLLVHSEPWPTDRVQVGLQALLLEHAGYRVSKAVLY
ncbi:MAG: Dna2/Cas4 domain-containing protein [Magnetococcales bacterium]|nr:Dna2/Cas4 domain-containing protein [Magnetococcales bacterium]